MVQFTSFSYIFNKYSIEPFSEFLRRNIAQLILVMFTGFIAFEITAHIEILALRVLLWLVVMSLELIVFHRIFFKEYTIGMVVKGKII